MYEKTYRHVLFKIQDIYVAYLLLRTKGLKVPVKLAIHVRYLSEDPVDFDIEAVGLGLGFGSGILGINLM